VRKHGVIKFNKGNSVQGQDLTTALIISLPLVSTGAATNCLPLVHDEYWLRVLTFPIFDYELKVFVVCVDVQAPAATTFAAIANKEWERVLTARP
jgi:hypothetical protein